MMRFFAARALVVVVVGSAACTNAQGSFGDIAWNPVTSAFAVADRHDLVVSRGTVVATRLPDNQQTLTLFFTAANVQSSDDWRRLGYSRFLDVRSDIAENDALLIDGVPLADVTPGAVLDVEWAGTGRAEGGAFDVAMALRPQVSSVESAPIGAQGRATLTIEDADPAAGGYVRGRLEVEREPDDTQDDGTASGIVTIAFQVPVVPERRGKANLGVARPIIVCAAVRGPTRSAGCRDESPEPELQASGLANLD